MLLLNYHSDQLWAVITLGFFTLIRVTVLTALAALAWVPVGVWIGLRPKVAYRIMPVVQFLAAFPANLLFPLMVMLILHHQLNMKFGQHRYSL